LIVLFSQIYLSTNLPTSGNVMESDSK